MRGLEKVKIKEKTETESGDALLWSSSERSESSESTVDGPANVSVESSVEVGTYVDADGGGNIILKTLYIGKHDIDIEEDIQIHTESEDVNGAIVQVSQIADIYQDCKIKVHIREHGDDIIVKMKVFEKSKGDLDTDVSITLTEDDVFYAEISQTANIVQNTTSDIKVVGDAEIYIDFLLSQIATVDQDADVVFEGTVDDFTVSVDVDQDVYLTQSITVDTSPDDLSIA